MNAAILSEVLSLRPRNSTTAMLTANDLRNVMARHGYCPKMHEAWYDLVGPGEADMKIIQAIVTLRG